MFRFLSCFGLPLCSLVSTQNKTFNCAWIPDCDLNCSVLCLCTLKVFRVAPLEMAWEVLKSEKLNLGLPNLRLMS